MKGDGSPSKIAVLARNGAKLELLAAVRAELRFAQAASSAAGLQQSSVRPLSLATSRSKSTAPRALDPGSVSWTEGTYIAVDTCRMAKKRRGRSAGRSKQTNAISKFFYNEATFMAK
jgi:hypothetical protein